VWMNRSLSGGGGTGVYLGVEELEWGWRNWGTCEGGGTGVSRGSGGTRVWVLKELGYM
jgi:hypothetical protein